MVSSWSLAGESTGRRGGDPANNKKNISTGAKGGGARGEAQRRNTGAQKV